MECSFLVQGPASRARGAQRSFETTDTCSIYFTPYLSTFISPCLLQDFVFAVAYFLCHSDKLLRCLFGERAGLELRCSDRSGTPYFTAKAKVTATAPRPSDRGMGSHWGLSWRLSPLTTSDPSISKSMLKQREGRGEDGFKG
ncbi:unnamed protein product [Pleuronectes platessa]|uniref:Uncharacterized protein n=1 Tax=Pleuronectes platessa TaxID=8262 RepID=A0A9N7UB05_PLEPL|nr:unnamed protein product [Pleuronectes platessa]